MKVRETYINATKGHRFGDSGGWIDAHADTVGGAFRAARAEFGRCVGKVYVDTTGGGAKQVGWVFQKRMRYDDDPKDSYLREVWVEVAESVVVPEEVVRYAEM